MGWQTFRIVSVAAIIFRIGQNNVCTGVVGIVGITTVLHSQPVRFGATSSSLDAAPVSVQLQMFLFLVLVFPLVEEIFFRGLLFGYALDYTKSVLVASLTTMVMFGLIHTEYGLIGVLTRSITSAVYVGQRVTYNSITESYLTHSVYNGLVFLGLIGFM
ncbi:CPBP family intramembrane glutamic endopeptidase [Natrinema caseinilyticum]|uniref:CPBP family intramembrane glutamic endopeptidase n=1 Tax=Natrinema caseinilyticum TaxID=2961570 RepID=UPI0020C4EC35|nr:CPBP family intramembrane glutamic endopeptidase [Natrinema caseinilyticum]